MGLKLVKKYLLGLNLNKLLMKENELTNNISSLYSKFFDVQKKTDPNCQCGNRIETKLLKIDLKMINYGTCEECGKIHYFKEINEYDEGKYNQKWQKIKTEDIKTEFEQCLDTLISQEVIEIPSPGFEVIIAKIQEMEEIKKIKKISFLNKEKEKMQQIKGRKNI